MGAWIETSVIIAWMVQLGRPSYGGRGLKQVYGLASVLPLRRPSYEGRGLKLTFLRRLNRHNGRPSYGGAWIETTATLPQW